AQPEPVPRPRLRKTLEAACPTSLKAVGRSARLTPPATKQPRPRFLHSLRNRQTLFLGFNRARARNKRDILPANQDVARRRWDAKNRVFFLGVPADQLVGLADGDALHDAGERLEDAQVNLPLIACNANGGAKRSGDRVGF